MKENITIIVNSSDGFEDCWQPFFKLVEIYWPDLNYPVLLNTERKDYSFSNFDLRTSKVHLGIDDRKLTWSECLISALEQIETPLVLYMQEDYFLETKVDSKTIAELAQLMLENNEIKYIGLTHFGNMPPFKKWNDERLVVVSKQAPYRISTQAALWKKETLLKYLRPDENGWMFEIFGSKRASKQDDLFLTANRQLFNLKTPIIYYEHTGIIKGKWHHRMPEVFLKHGISINFNERGIYKPKNWLVRKFETGRKLLRNPLMFFYKIRGN